MKTYRVKVRLGGLRLSSDFQGQSDEKIEEDFIKQLEKGNFSIDDEGVYRGDRLFFFYEEIKNDTNSKQGIVSEEDGVGEQVEQSVSTRG